MQQTAPIQVERMLQVDLLHVGVRRPADTDHVHAVAVQMERMAEIRLLHWRRQRRWLGKRFGCVCVFLVLPQFTLIDQHNLDDGVQRNVNLVRAHAVRAAVGRSIVAVAELLRIDLVVLRDERRRRGQVGDLVDQRDDVIAGRCNCVCVCVGEYARVIA